MSVYVVTWNLNKERSNYSAARAAFIGQLERYDNIADPDLESVRFVSTTSTVDQVSEFLRQKMDENDKIFVAKANRSERQGWLATSVWEWINARS